ncbi:MAG: hypothetical protein ACI9WH_002016 [Glaciecola sp.]|jgi:hypothetical protein
MFNKIFLGTTLLCVASASYASIMTIEHDTAVAVHATNFSTTVTLPLLICSPI